MTCALLLAGALLAALGCFGRRDGEPALLEGYNVVLINVDTLRADRLGSYGYRPDTSPFLDSVAREGVVFERAIANFSYTRESAPALREPRVRRTARALPGRPATGSRADSRGLRPRRPTL